MKKTVFLALFTILVISTLYSQTSHLENRVITFNNTIFNIPKPKEYNFFQNSIFKTKSIGEFTKTNQLPIEVQHFDFLVPFDLEKQPAIHLFTFKMLNGINLTQSQFDEQKKYLIDAYESGGYNKLSEQLFSDSSFIKRNGKIVARQSGFIVLSNTANLLTSLLIIDDETLKKKSSLAVIQNEIFIKNTIVTIKLTMDYNKFEDIVALKSFSDEYIKAFLLSNR